MLLTIKALFIDDEDDFRSLTKIFLEKSGMIEVTLAPTADYAFELLSQSTYDIIISDYLMPRMNGVEFYNYIREKLSWTSFVLFTAQHREDVMVEALNSGVDFYQRKMGDTKAMFLELEQKIVQLVVQKRWIKSLVNGGVLSPRLQKKSQMYLPDYSFDQIGLKGLIDVTELQILVDSLYNLYRFEMAILDLKGNILVRSPWQDICVNFFRAHPLTCKNCTESDVYLTQNVQPGNFLAYKCKNGLWDVVTPIFVAGKHLGNLFFGQFFYEDEVIDHSFYLKIAKKCHFDEERFMDALDRVPRLPRDMVDKIMDFDLKLTSIISKLSYSNLLLGQEISRREFVERDLLEHRKELQQLNSKLNLLAEVTTHDIKNKINAIKMLRDLMLTTEGNEKDDLLRRMDNAINSILKQVDFFQTYHSFGKQPMRWHELTPLLIGCLRGLDLGEVEVVLDLDGVSVNGDPMLSKVFDNMLENSLRHGSGVKKIRIYLEQRSGMYLVVYEDDGGGIAPDKKEKIFDYGFGKNMGLGLFLARQILELSSISIVEKGEHGKGVRFELSLPNQGVRVIPSS